MQRKIENPNIMIVFVFNCVCQKVKVRKFKCGKFKCKRKCKIIMMHVLSDQVEKTVKESIVQILEDTYKSKNMKTG